MFPVSLCLLVLRYGPFWIATTLVFVTAVTGNYASYVSYKHKHASATGSETQAWYYDIDKVSSIAVTLCVATMLIVCTFALVPVNSAAGQ